ncbi:MAG: GNAT family N-acetyltransferase [Acidobacteria bacterium]|nr:GNAT family N-acetyltransferase [Acidobacteriota bacterium]
MPLTFRLARPDEHAHLKRMIIDTFEPITWSKPADGRFGLMNGLDWRDRWNLRLEKVFAHQIILVGELDGKVAACATGTYEEPTAMGFVDILSVGQTFQGQGLGREMLRGMIEHFKSLGGAYVHLDCLTTNEVANNLYKAEGFEEAMRSVRWMKKL